MVTKRFTQGLAWLHARVGRRLPITVFRDNEQRTLNSRPRLTLSTAPALHPTVYLQPGTDRQLVA
jgi:hypothetical protein